MRALLGDNKLIWEAFITDKIKDYTSSGRLITEAPAPVQVANPETQPPLSVNDSIFTDLKREAIRRATEVSLLGGAVMRRMLSNVQFHNGEEGGTMAVDDAGNIYINRDFFSSILKDDPAGDIIIGVFEHEAMHILNGTMRRKKNRNHSLWNVATDFVMNRDLTHPQHGTKLPEGVLLPVMRGEEAWVVFAPADYGIEGFTGHIEFEFTNDTAEQVFVKLYKGLQRATIPPPESPPTDPPAGPPPPTAPTAPIAPGDIIAITDGPLQGSFGRIARVRDDGGYDIEELPEQQAKDIVRSQS
mgnify:CR=1 FL=1